MTNTIHTVKIRNMPQIIVVNSKKIRIDDSLLKGKRHLTQDEIKILKKRIEMAGGVVVLPHSLTKRGEVKVVLCNKCINPVLKELEEK